MIIDKSRKVIYLHNPKCGGTFLRDIYQEKYGDTEAIRWWKLYSREYGTDLGHISYDDLPRFVPDFEEYRLLMMVRNPYNRFISGYKETKSQFSTPVRLGGLINYPRAYYGSGEEYNRLSKVEKVYEQMKSALPFTFLHELRKIQLLSAPDFCKWLGSSNRKRQDLFLRNKRIPWLNPQSDFIGSGVTVLHYESVSDWSVLFEAFGLMEYSGRLSIAKDYTMDESFYQILERLYPDDKQLFDWYKKIT